MEHITVKAGQSLLDIAVEHCGSMEALVSLAAANGIGVADELAAGQELAPVEVADRRNAELFANMRQKPATALTVEDIGEAEEAYGALEGIFDYTYDETYN